MQRDAGPIWPSLCVTSLWAETKPAMLGGLFLPGGIGSCDDWGPDAGWMETPLTPILGATCSQMILRTANATLEDLPDFGPNLFHCFSPLYLWL